jgi:hypothetical protein
MKLMLTLDPQLAPKPINYKDKLLLIGSCFSDSIGARLAEAKFQTRHNVTGIVYDPLSIARHLTDIAEGKQYVASELFQFNELWHSWQHHSDFSSTKQGETLNHINRAIRDARQQLQSASHLFITLGTAYAYRLIKQKISVANNHKAPADWFERRLLSIDEMVNVLLQSIQQARMLNPTIQVVFTVSPVKHIRDGIVENGLSKARLLEVVYAFTQSDANNSYFPAYELVTDVLRDYRFYAADMAHPNELAINFVFDFFCQTYFTHQTQLLMQDVLQIVSAQNHRPLHVNTDAHQQFLKTFLAKTEALKVKMPELNWEKEVAYFKG